MLGWLPKKGPKHFHVRAIESKYRGQNTKQKAIYFGFRLLNGPNPTRLIHLDQHVLQTSLVSYTSTVKFSKPFVSNLRAMSNKIITDTCLLPAGFFYLQARGEDNMNMRNVARITLIFTTPQVVESEDILEGLNPHLQR